jgi:hypothetical protein
MRGMKIKRIIIAITIVAMVLVTYLLWPPGVAETLPLEVRFIGYGTDAAGERTATFTLANGGDILLLRETHCRVEYQDDQQLVPAYSVALTRALVPGESETVSIPAPPGRGAWRAGFKVQKQDRHFDAIDWANKHSLIPDAIRTRNHNARIKISWGEWIAD